jgi:NitT/TauT family transport system substrate-binding protein
MRLRIGRVSLVGVVLVVLSACGGTAPTAASPTATVRPSAAASPTAAPRVALKVNWTALTGANSGLWTAVEAGYFKDENLDVELVNINSSSRSIAALIAKEVQIGFSDGANTVQAVAQGAGVKLFQSVTNHLVFSIMAKQSVADVKDLRGKKIGITTIGSSTHTAALQALKIAGLKDSDVTLVPLTEVPNILAALTAGQIDAGSVSPPTNSRAKAAGFKEIINLAVDGPDYPSVAIASTTEYMTANPDVIKRFVKAYSRGVERFRKDKEFGTKAIDKYLKIGDPAILEDTWTQFSKYIELPPYVKGLEVAIAEAATTNAKAASLKPTDVYDATFVKQLDDEGYFKSLKP